MKKYALIITLLSMILMVSSPTVSLAQTVDTPSTSVSGTYGKENIALGKTVIPSTNTVLGNPSAIVDGNHWNYWYSYQGSPSYQDFVLDLGDIHKLGKINILALQIYGCSVSTSVDGVNWDVVFNKGWYSINAPLNISLDGNKEARYIKYHGYANWPQYVGVSEIEVYDWVSSESSSGQIGTTNIALNKNVENINLNDFNSTIPGYSEQNAVDGNISTSTLPSTSSTANGYYWTRGYVRVDLGQVYTLGKIVVNPKNAHWVIAEMSETKGSLPNGTLSEFVAPWVSKSYPDLISSNSSTSEKIIFILDKPVKARYIWIMTGTDSSTINLSPGVSEIEAYEWIEGITDTEAATSTVNTSSPSDLWNNNNVTGTINAVDNAGGLGVKEIHYSINGGAETVIAGDNANFTINEEGVSNLSYYAVDNAGNVEQSKSIEVKIDKTAPTLSFSGNLGTYSTDMNISISCNAEDSLSGIAVPCDDININASSLPLGENTISRTVTDNAGNITTQSVTFTVVPSVDPWTELVELVKKHTAKKGIVNSLLAKVDAAHSAYNRGDNTAKANILGAFINEVEAQTDKAIAAEHAKLLISKAKALQ